MDKFRTISLFMSTIETGSFAATARKHATDPSTVSKAIKRLEEQLGLQLFFRSTRKLSLTSAGEQYAETVGALFQQLGTFEEELTSANDRISGTLKLNLPMNYGHSYVLPMLIEFKKAYPDICLDVSFNDEYVDMIGNAVDVSIRSGTLSDSRLVAQKLTPMDFVICAASEVADKATISIDKDCLQAHPWVLFRFKQTGKTMPIAFDYQGKHIHFEPQQTATVDSGKAMADMCAAGLGLILISHFTVKDLVAQGRLKVLAKVDDFAGTGIYIVYPKRQHLPKRTQVFIQFVKDYLKAQGEGPENTWLTSHGF